MDLRALILNHPLTDAVKVSPSAGGVAYPKPFVHWVGGKREFIARYPDLIPKDFNTYYEPFLGGGAMLFHLNPSSAVLADGNPELIRAYCGLRDHVDEVIDILLLAERRHSPGLFLDIRQQDRVRDLTELSDAEVAARLIYLNRTCFNGLYRVNRKGEFNTSIGYTLNKLICDPRQLRATSDFLQGKRFASDDFANAMSGAGPGDFIFLDPPYAPLGGHSDFVRYTKEQFSDDDQMRVAKAFADASNRGARVMMTNSSAPIIRELYRDYVITEVGMSRSVNVAADKRGDVQELVVTNYPVDAPGADVHRLSGALTGG